MGIEDFALHMEGFTDEQVAQIEAIKPDLLHVFATYQAIKPRLDRIAPVVRMVLEVINRKVVQ